MTREEIKRIALEVGFDDGEVNTCQLMLERFAYLVAQQERERIKQANAPEIERINAHIKQLEALAHPEQEPVAWISPKELLVMRGNAYAGAKDWRVNLGLEPEEGDVGLYITPPQRTWVGLTLDERIELAQDVDWAIGAYCEYAEKIEAKLRSKNESKN